MGRDVALQAGIRVGFRGVAATLGAVAALAIAGQASAEILHDDPSFEISGTGYGSQRVCTILLKPSQTFRADKAPRVEFETAGLSEFRIAVEGPVRYADTTIVQDNLRIPMPPEAGVSVDRFNDTEIGHALNSERLFFLTARTEDGTYTSSRFDNIDFQAILVNIQEYCPFDAESLFKDVTYQESRERLLSLSDDQLLLIRWALGKDVGGTDEEPFAGSNLSAIERAYLKRYNADNGLPVSGFLTSETARRLEERGQELRQAATPPEPVYSDYYTFKACNNNWHVNALAVAHPVSPTDSDFLVEGWFHVPANDCIELTFPKGWLYFYAEKLDSGGSTYWGGSELDLCVDYPGPFERINSGGYTCDNNELKGFNSKFIEYDQEDFTWTMDP